METFVIYMRFLSNHIYSYTIFKNVFDSCVFAKILQWFIDRLNLSLIFLKTSYDF